MKLISSASERAKAATERYNAMTRDEKIAHNAALLDNPHVPDPVKTRILERQQKLTGERDGFLIIGIGLVYASVCTRLTDEEATVKLNAAVGTGTASGWKISADKAFATGQPNPCECPDYPGHRHILFNC